MADILHLIDPKSVEQAHRHIETLRKQRPMMMTAYLRMVSSGFVAGMALFIEWKTIGLALQELFPTLSSGYSFVDVTGPLAFASIGAIVMGDVLLAKASEYWSERARRRLLWCGLAALILFVIAAMAFLPASIWQANDMSNEGAGNPAMSTGAYVAFATMLAALFPVSLLSNFLLFEGFKASLAKLEHARQIEGRIGFGNRLLARISDAQSALRKVRKSEAQSPSQEQIDKSAASRLSACIGKVASQIHYVILLREAAANGSPDKPLAATEHDHLNALPIERLQSMFDYLTTFTPDFIQQLTTRRSA